MSSKSSSQKPSIKNPATKPEDIEIAEEDIKTIQRAIKRVETTMAAWNKAATVSPEKMRKPLTR